MMKWLLSVVGVVFLGVMFDLVYPRGKTNTLCKSIFGVIAVFVMISPILKFDVNNIDNSIDTTIIDSTIMNAMDSSYERKLLSKLKDMGIDGLNVEIEGKMFNNMYEISNVYIDTTNIVLEKNFENINKYEVITSETSKILNVLPERIVIYG